MIPQMNRKQNPDLDRQVYWFPLWISMQSQQAFKSNVWRSDYHSTWSPQIWRKFPTESTASVFEGLLEGQHPFLVFRYWYWESICGFIHVFSPFLNRCYPLFNDFPLSVVLVWSVEDPYRPIKGKSAMLRQIYKLAFIGIYLEFTFVSFVQRRLFGEGVSRYHQLRQGA